MKRRRREALEHRVHRERDDDQVGAERVLTGDVCRVVVPDMVVYRLFRYFRRVAVFHLLLTGLDAVGRGSSDLPATTAHHADVRHLLDEEHQEEAGADEHLAGRQADVWEQPRLLDHDEHLPHLGQHVREDGGEQHSGAEAHDARHDQVTMLAQTRHHSARLTVREALSPEVRQPH